MNHVIDSDTWHDIYLERLHVVNEKLIGKSIIKNKKQIVELLNLLEISNDDRCKVYGDNDTCCISYGDDDLSIVRVGEKLYYGEVRWSSMSFVKKKWDTSTMQWEKEIVNYLWKRRKKINKTIVRLKKEKNIKYSTVIVMPGKPQIIKDRQDVYNYLQYLSRCIIDERKLRENINSIEDRIEIKTIDIKSFKGLPIRLSGNKEIESDKSYILRNNNGNYYLFNKKFKGEYCIPITEEEAIESILNNLHGVNIDLCHKDALWFNDIFNKKRMEEIEDVTGKTHNYISWFKPGSKYTRNYKLALAIYILNSESIFNLYEVKNALTRISENSCQPIIKLIKFTYLRKCLCALIESFMRSRFLHAHPYVVCPFSESDINLKVTKAKKNFNIDNAKKILCSENEMIIELKDETVYVTNDGKWSILIDDRCQKNQKID